MIVFDKDFIDYGYMGKLNDIALKSLENRSANTTIDPKCENDDLKKVKKHSCKVILKVLQGRLANKELSKEDKFDFNKIVFPQLLKNRSDIKDGFSGLIECHLRDSQLNHIEVRGTNKQ